MRKSILLAIVGLVVACNAALGVTITGTSSFFGLTSGTSGGIPYFSSTSTAASSAALGSTNIVVGGGAGAAPTAVSCTITSVIVFTCTSSTNSAPVLSLQNQAADTSGPFLNGYKDRSGGAVQSGDALFNITSQGNANSGTRSAASIVMSVAAAPSGSNIPSKIQFTVTDAAGTAAAGMLLDNNVHQSYTSSGVPTLTSCGSGSPTVTTGSTDVAGTVTDGTTTTGCVLTFKVAYAAAPFCVVGMQTQQAAFSYTISSTTITTTHTSGSSLKWNYVCHGA